MDVLQEALSGPAEIRIRLDPIQAASLRTLAAAWGMSPDQALTGIVSSHLTEVAAAVVDLPPSARRGTH